MSIKKLTSLRLSDRDLDFLIETLSPDSADKSRIRQILGEDADFRNAFLQEERLFILTQA